MRVPDVVCVERGERRRGRLERDRDAAESRGADSDERIGPEQFEPRETRTPDERLAEVEAERGEKRLGEERRTGAQGRLHEPDLPSTAGYLDRAPQAVHSTPDQLRGLGAHTGARARDRAANHDAGSCTHHGCSRMPKSSATTEAALYPAASQESAGGQTAFDR